MNMQVFSLAGAAGTPSSATRFLVLSFPASPAILYRIIGTLWHKV